MNENKLYTVRHPDCTTVTLYGSSPQNACRKAFRYWIARKELKRQPKSLDDGGFEGVEVEI